jgi:hypothetical protein
MSRWLRGKGHVDTRAGRALALVLVFSFGLAASFALFAGGNAAARDALTKTTLAVCEILHCGTLTVAADVGEGSGTFTSDPAGIDCVFAPQTTPGATIASTSGVCAYRFFWPSTQPLLYVGLVPTPSAGSFVTGGGGPGQVVLANGANTTVEVSFTGHPEYLTVSASGAGSGVVTSQPAGIDCGTVCVSPFDFGAPLLLTAVPSPGDSFLDWTGACAGQGAICTLTTPDMASSTDVVFGLPGQTTGVAGTTTKPATSTSSTTTTTTTKTTPNSTTTGATTTTTTTTTTATVGLGAHPALNAQLLAARSARSKRDARLVEVEIATNETTTVLLDLTRGTKRLARRTIRALVAGKKVLTLVVPIHVGEGKAVIHATVETSTGDKQAFHTGVKIASA